jgi:Arc/MetJ-type ribon-helix-helix transcriptional regulator
MTFQDHAMSTAYQMGAYKAIAEMMRDAVRELQSGDEFERDWATKRLVMLADQLEETEEKFKKEVDTVAA